MAKIAEPNSVTMIRKVIKEEFADDQAMRAAKRILKNGVDELEFKKIAPADLDVGIRIKVCGALRDLKLAGWKQ